MTLTIMRAPHSGLLIAQSLALCAHSLPLNSPVIGGGDEDCGNHHHQQSTILLIIKSSPPKKYNVKFEWDLCVPTACL